MADKVHKLAKELDHHCHEIYEVKRRPWYPLGRGPVATLERILRAELKPLLHWAKECTRGRHEDGECNDQCTPDNCRFTKLAAELEGWATQRGGNSE